MLLAKRTSITSDTKEPIAKHKFSTLKPVGKTP